jgi:hypothetical protein
MTRKINFYLVLLFVVSPFVTEAQLLNRIKRAAEQGVSNAVEKRVEREVENATQRQLEKALGEIYGAEADSARVGYDLGRIVKGINVNVPTEDAYHFTGKAEMEMSGTDEKGKAIDPVLMTSFLNEDSEYSGMEFTADREQQKDGIEKTIMIFDRKNKASIILMENDGEKTRVAFGFDDDVDESILKNDTLEYENIKFEKTGRTKTIAGHLCEEYKAETDEYEAFYWATEEPLGIGSFWGKNSPLLTKKMKNANKEYFEMLPEGDILEITSQSKKDKSTWNMTMTSLEASTSTSFVMADYPNMMEGQTAEN